MIVRAVRLIRQRASAVRPIAASLFVIALAPVAAAPATFAQSSQSAASAKGQSDGCAADNGGITLPPGFAQRCSPKSRPCPADGLRPRRCLYVNTWSGTLLHNDKVSARRFSDRAPRISKGDGRAERSSASATRRARLGRRHRHSRLQERPLRRTERQDHPLSAADRRHRAEGKSAGHRLGTAAHRRSSDASFRHRREGHLFVDLGSATNSCQFQNRMPNSPGHQPCTELETRAGIWRYDANKKDQHFSPAERYATGLRNGEGFAFDSADVSSSPSTAAISSRRTGRATSTRGKARSCRPRRSCCCRRAPTTAGPNATTISCRTSSCWRRNMAATAKRSVCAPQASAGRGVSRPLGAERSSDLCGNAVSCGLSGRRVCCIPRLVESRAGTARRLQRRVSAARRRQGGRTFHRLCRRFCRRGQGAGPGGVPAVGARHGARTARSIFPRTCTAGSGASPITALPMRHPHPRRRKLPA